MHDTLELPRLLKQTQLRFTEIYGDAGYLSRINCFEIRAKGATPYIRPKKTTRIADKARTAFNDMVRSYQANPHQWLRRYHRRNRVESTFAAIKRRLGGRIRSLKGHTIRIEACLKLLAWNLTRFSPCEL